MTNNDKFYGKARYDEQLEEIMLLKKIVRSVKRENEGVLTTRGCILCGAYKSSLHTCGL